MRTKGYLTLGAEQLRIVNIFNSIPYFLTQGPEQAESRTRLAFGSLLPGCQGSRQENRGVSWELGILLFLQLVWA